MNDNINIQKLFDEEIIDSDLVSKLKAVPNQMPTPINWNQLFDGTTIILSFWVCLNALKYIDVQTWTNQILITIYKIIYDFIIRL